MAKELGRKPGAIQKSWKKWELSLSSALQATTTEIPLANGLLTHEQALKVLAGALKLLQQQGQDKLELQRLRILVDAVRSP